MEYKKFNNAIEKAENLSEDTQRVKQSENSPQTEQEKRLARMKEVEEQRARVRARQEEIRRKKLTRPRPERRFCKESFVFVGRRTHSRAQTNQI